MSSHKGSFSSEQNGKLNKPVACCVFHDSGVGRIRKELRDAEWWKLLRIVVHSEVEMDGMRLSWLGIVVIPAEGEPARWENRSLLRYDDVLLYVCVMRWN